MPAKLFGEQYTCQPVRFGLSLKGSTGVVMLLRELHKQAQLEGGAVYMLNGNHESLNVSGNFRYAIYKCAFLCRDSMHRTAL